MAVVGPPLELLTVQVASEILLSSLVVSLVVMVAVEVVGPLALVGDTAKWILPARF